jgi:hypothetical protein
LEHEGQIHLPLTLTKEFNDRKLLLQAQAEVVMLLFLRLLPQAAHSFTELCFHPDQ